MIQTFPFPKVCQCRVIVRRCPPQVEVHRPVENLMTSGSERGEQAGEGVEPVGEVLSFEDQEAAVLSGIHPAGGL